MMTRKLTNIEMRDVLAQKLVDEQTDFKRSDVRVQKVKENKRFTKWTVYVKGYEHCKFSLTLGNEEDQFWVDRCGKYFAVVTGVEFMDEAEQYIEWSNYEDEAMTSALKYIGYYIGTRF